MIHMEEATSKGLGKRVGVSDFDEVGDSMHCIYHPHKNNNNNNNPGGICAFCLQEKLGKLVSSSFPLPPIHPSSSSSSSPSSPSFRSTIPSFSSSSSISHPHANNTHVHHTRSRLPFLNNKKNKSSVNSASSSASATSSDVTFKRSNSTATPRRGKFLEQEDFNFSPRKRNGFWSFLYLSAASSKNSKKLEVKSFKDINGSPRISTGKPREKYLGSSLGRKTDMVVVEENDSVSSSVSASVSSFERKVSRSRSVGCGSRSFSGDILERISSGLGDCTLRRVESQREGKNKVASAVAGVSTAVNRGGENHHNCMKERVKCGGIFGGFVITSSSSSSYIVSSSVDYGESTGVGLGISHGRSRSRSWAFASPMRAFSSKTSSKDNKRDENSGVKNDSGKNSTPNLSAIPSLLTVRG